MTLSQPLLSIAIPTYNRAKELNAALAAVFAQIDALGGDAVKVEVVVCSNGSTDDTDAVVSRHQHRPQLRYFVNDRNYGIDENIRRVVRHTRGEFVRLLSDDDTLVPGSIQALLGTLESHPEIGFLFLNAATLTEENGVVGVRAPEIMPTPVESSGMINRMDPDAFLGRIGVWISFISSFVFRRSLWVNELEDQAYIGTDIFLSYKAMDVIAAAGEAYFSPRIAVGVRPHFSGNYRIFNAFGPEMRKLFLEHGTSLGFSAGIMQSAWARSFNEDLLPRVGRARLSGTFGREERKLVKGVATGGAKVRAKTMMMMSAPLWLLNGLKALRKGLISKKAESWPFIAVS
jgi:glycosyltransferase involved in cell wall biosynthesis